MPGLEESVAAADVHGGTAPQRVRAALDAARERLGQRGGDVTASTRVAVVGAAGYAGGELVRLLAGHPSVEIASVHARGRAGTPLAASCPTWRRSAWCSATTSRTTSRSAFLALPHGASAPLASRLLERGATVVDIGADFRLRDADAYATWYGAPHPCPELLADAVYGLTEWSRDALRGTKLIANPGCYPTASLLALIPFARAGLLVRRPDRGRQVGHQRGRARAPARTTCSPS